MSKATEAMNEAKQCLKCKRKAKNGEDYCPWHRVGANPNIRNLNLEASLVNVKIFISRMVQECRRGGIEPKVLAAMISGCNALIKIHEIEEVQQVLVKMQKDVLRQRLNEVELPEGSEIVFDDANMNPVKYSMDLGEADGEVREGIKSN